MTVNRVLMLLMLCILMLALLIRVVSWAGSFFHRNKNPVVVVMRYHVVCRNHQETTE